jgi:hypothetical protein
VERELARLDESASPTAGVFGADTDAPSAGAKSTGRLAKPTNELPGTKQSGQQRERQEEGDKEASARCFDSGKDSNRYPASTAPGNVDGGVLRGGVRPGPSLGTTAIVGQHTVPHTRAALLLFLHPLPSNTLVLNVAAKRLSIENSHCCVRSFNCNETRPQIGGLLLLHCGNLRQQCQ